MGHFSAKMEQNDPSTFINYTAADNGVYKCSCTYGIPDGILSDQGTQFQSKFLDLVYDTIEIKRLKITPYYPQSDHPELKKGLSQGIARKYYGPFEIVGVNPNGLDYFNKLVDLYDRKSNKYIKQAK
ncbi:unnamed protein product [Brachionus calyciflorus]|uniref:Integrase catalytic domain-containing protein n=1 Tax=Brachionus calyciflorus TaxID=104777 RepID=A0A814HFH3_9BILA|nr:unnamed protein product [Brachionus calyciflorus]